MRVHILLILICGILAVRGSPLDVEGKGKNKEVLKAAETLKENKTTKTAELGKVAEGDENAVLADAAEVVKDENLDATVEADISPEVQNEIEASEVKETVEAEAVPAELENKSAEIPAETKVVESADKPEEKATTVDRESDVPEGRPVAQANIIVQTIFQSQPLVPDSVRKVGPVEHGLRNVVAASAAATEEYFMKMSALNAEISQLINSKSEILTSQTMNNLFAPLNKVENTIKKTGDCGKAYEASLNSIFKDIDLSLKTCSKNLTTIESQYKSDNVGALTSLSFAADEMNNLPDSCEISLNFAVGTFCIVNNLAEMNDRVLSDVSFIKHNTAQTEEKIVVAIAEFDVCQQKMSETVTGKLEKLLKEVTQKCVERKNTKSN